MSICVLSLLHADHMECQMQLRRDPCEKHRRKKIHGFWMHVGVKHHDSVSVLGVFVFSLAYKSFQLMSQGR